MTLIVLLLAAVMAQTPEKPCGISVSGIRDCAAHPPRVASGHYERRVMRWPENGKTVVQRFWEWIPPSDCTSWPEGLVWAGGIVYDKRGCAYPKINGQCNKDYAEQSLPDPCFEKPPVEEPKEKQPRNPK